LVTAVKWVSALFLTFRLLLLPVAAAPGCPLSGCNHQIQEDACSQFAFLLHGLDSATCVVHSGEIAAADGPLLISTPQTPSPHGDPKPQQ
jgi:hypothetical protein